MTVQVGQVYLSRISHVRGNAIPTFFLIKHITPTMYTYDIVSLEGRAHLIPNWEFRKEMIDDHIQRGMITLVDDPKLITVLKMMLI